MIGSTTVAKLGPHVWTRWPPSWRAVSASGGKPMIDVAEQISAVRREVGGRVLEAGEARVVTLSRTYSTELSDLWDACTNPERIPRWFLPVAGELHEGGRYQLEGNAG